MLQIGVSTQVLAKNFPGLPIRSNVLYQAKPSSHNIRSKRFQKVGRIRIPFVARKGAASGSPKVGTIQPTDWN